MLVWIKVPAFFASFNSAMCGLVGWWFKPASFNPFGPTSSCQQIRCENISQENVIGTFLVTAGLSRVHRHRCLVAAGLGSSRPP